MKRYIFVKNITEYDLARKLKVTAWNINTDNMTVELFWCTVIHMTDLLTFFFMTREIMQLHKLLRWKPLYSAAKRIVNNADHDMVEEILNHTLIEDICQICDEHPNETLLTLKNKFKIITYATNFKLKKPISNKT